MGFKFNISSFSEFFLDGDSSWVVKRIRVVSVIVGLNQEPLSFTELIECMDTFGVSFDDGSFISLNSWNNVINWASNFLILESLKGSIKGWLLSQSSSQQPNCWHSVIKHDADQVLWEMLCFSCVNINGKWTMSDTCQCKHTAYNRINAENSLVSLVIFHIDNQVRNKVPHLEIQISSV